jgi:hypothetical protein
MATKAEIDAKIAWEKTTKESYLEEGEPKTPADVAAAEAPESGEEEPVEESAEAAPEDEEPAPPSSKRPAPPPAAKGPKASLAHLAGLPETSSDVAIRTEITRRVTVYEHAARLTNASDPAQIIGHLDAIVRDAAEVGRLRTERDAAVRKANAQERMDLLTKLEAMGGPGHTRGDLFVDIVEGGKIVGRRPAKLWGPGGEGRSLANLRGYVAAKLSNAAPTTAKRSPFEPDPKLAEQGARVTEQDRAIAQRHGFDPERVAASRSALFGSNSATARGV